MLEAISLIKNVCKKSPTAENYLNNISKAPTSNIRLSFVNQNIKLLIAKNKTDDNFKIVEETKTVRVSLTENLTRL